MTPTGRWIAALALASTLAAAPARAGQVDGPFLIWMNFAEDDSANRALHDYTHGPDDADKCWRDEGRLLVGNFPPAITPALVQRAVIRRERAAQATLKALLRRGDDRRTDGYDGVIVVPRSLRQTLVSFGADGKVRSHSARTRAGELDWPDAFCAVQPPVLRKP